MHILFLDTASAEPILMLSTAERVVMQKVLPKQGESHVVTLLENALKETGWSYDTLTHIACIIGPGGFVSLRIGVTVINTLAWTLGLPSAGVHLSDVWFARIAFCSNPNPPASKGSPNPNFLWLHSTRKTPARPDGRPGGQLFMRGFGEYEKRFPEPTLMDLEQIATVEAGYIGELLEEHRQALSGCTPLPSSHVQSLEGILPSFLAGLPYKKEQLVPWYGREA